MSPTKFDALKNLCPTSKFVMSQEGVILNSKLKNGEKLPTEEQIQAKLSELQADYDSKKYQRDRAVAYDPIREQLDQIYHDIDGWKAKIKAVKDKYPKPT